MGGEDIADVGGVPVAFLIPKLCGTGGGNLNLGLVCCLGDDRIAGGGLCKNDR